MKTLLILTLFIFSQVALAAKIESFKFINSPIAEICGVVENATAPIFVQVQVDPTVENTRTYSTVTNNKGKFCLVVTSFRGEAEVSVIKD